MSLNKNKSGNLIIPQAKPLPDKVWITTQCSRTFRNNVTKIAEKHGLNISQYIRKKLEELIIAANNGTIKKVMFKNDNTVCPHCGEVLNVSGDLT
jgi:hypothetical protein